jgi:DNA polymerase I - 3''-5'' exonuclease and polymerase domains
MEIPPVAKPDDIVALDSEWFGLNERKLHRPQGIQTFACCQFSFDGETAYIVTAPDAIIKAYDHIRKATLVFCNAAFDYVHLRQLAEFPPKKKMWDIQLFEKILFGGYYSKFSLKDMVRRYFQVAMPKEAREEFAKGSAMTEEMLQYAADDVCYTWRIYQEQNKIARDEDVNIWYNVELPAFWPTIEFAGFPLNATKWTNLANFNNEKALELEKTFTFNPGSHVQVKKFIKENYKIDLESSDEAHLLKIQNKCEIAKTILDYRHYKKRASTYGLSWLEAIEADGRVHSQFNQLGAETGRYSSDNINLQNVPHDPETRGCFEAPEGYVLCKADFAGQEPRIICHLSKDKELTNIFMQGRDVHSEVAQRVYDTEEKIIKGDPRRAVGKRVELMLSYGAKAKGLVRALLDEDNMVVTEEEAQRFINEFFSNFPGVEQYMQKQKKFADKWEYVLSALGRKIHVNKYSYQSENCSSNSPIQSTGAEMIKLALASFYQAWKPEWGPFGVCAVVHDEIDVICKYSDAEEISKVLKFCMEESGKSIIDPLPCIAEVDISQSWAGG